jgi:hypothetical protein
VRIPERPLNGRALVEAIAADFAEGGE